MKTFLTTSTLKNHVAQNTVIAIGNYDGVHLGHQEILKKLVAEAKNKNCKAVVLSFAPHPVKVLAPDVAPLQIQTIAQKTEILEEYGIDILVLQKFDSEFAKISPEDFFKTHLLENLKAKAIFVGYDFTFGTKRSGTTETLERFGKEHGVDVHIVPAKMHGETLVSSSLIRKLVLNGDVKKAKEFLTRPFFIDGKVIPGFKRGTALGIHTANLATENELLPKDGVYATLVKHKGVTYESVTNIGYNPTFDNVERSIETHIFDFDQEIYDEALRLVFIEKIRDEIKFANPGALVKQIEKDILEAKGILKSVVKGFGE